MVGYLPVRLTQKNEKTLALEIVTHPDAPGLAEFEAKLISYFNTLGIKPHYHLGKNMPPSVKSYKDFFSREALNEFNMALLNWYGSKENIIHSPFMSPYFQAMLGLDPGVTLDDVTLLAPEKRLKPEHTDKEIRHFLGKLDTLLDSSSNKKIIPKSSPHQKALAQFKEEVSDALEYSKHLSQYPGTAV
jgi:L-gulonolactone oxidase